MATPEEAQQKEIGCGCRSELSILAKDQPASSVESGQKLIAPLTRSFKGFPHGLQCLSERARHGFMLLLLPRTHQARVTFLLLVSPTCRPLSGGSMGQTLIS